MNHCIWADPKFYDIPKKVFFCSAKCSLVYYEKIKGFIQKSLKIWLFSYDYFAQQLLH